MVRRVIESDYEALFASRFGESAFLPSHHSLRDRLFEEFRFILASPFRFDAAFIGNNNGKNEVVSLVMATLISHKASVLIKDLSAGIYPHPKLRVLYENGCDVFPSMEDIGRANSAEGVSLFFAYVWSRPEIEGEGLQQKRSTMNRFFMRQKSGIKIKESLLSCFSQYREGATELGMVPLWEAVDEWGNEVSLMHCDRKLSLKSSNPFVSEFFAYSRPTFKLRPSGQELLRLCFIEGLSDAEICEKLKIRKSAVTDRWKHVRNVVLAVSSNRRDWGEAKQEVWRNVQENPSVMWPFDD